MEINILKKDYDEEYPKIPWPVHTPDWYFEEVTILFEDFENDYPPATLSPIDKSRGYIPAWPVREFDWYLTMPPDQPLASACFWYLTVYAAWTTQEGLLWHHSMLPESLRRGYYETTLRCLNHSGGAIMRPLLGDPCLQQVVELYLQIFFLNLVQRPATWRG